ncbi:hypothetical protein Glove_120g210 [Diversispora epigaea]|uniref:Uncharacterized protein n=1 Tax=Diversispora epigaea TaxID=1348612 RepID=A0A397J8C7_9GLOM|nr:hypothetical protein Glove_120g210 [Diversispora epigaea]
MRMLITYMAQLWPQKFMHLGRLCLYAVCFYTGSTTVKLTIASALCEWDRYQDISEIPLTSEVGLRTKALIRLQLTLRNIIIVNKNLLKQAIEEAVSPQRPHIGKLAPCTSSAKSPLTRYRFFLGRSGSLIMNTLLSEITDLREENAKISKFKKENAVFSVENAKLRQDMEEYETRFTKLKQNETLIHCETNDSITSITPVTPEQIVSQNSTYKEKVSKEIIRIVKEKKLRDQESSSEKQDTSSGELEELISPLIPCDTIKKRLLQKNPYKIYLKNPSGIRV